MLSKQNIKTRLLKFCRVLSVLVLCVVVGSTSCTDKEDSFNQDGPGEWQVTLSLSDLTYNSATFIGHLDIVASYLSFSRVTFSVRCIQE